MTDNLQFYRALMTVNTSLNEMQALTGRRIAVVERGLMRMHQMAQSSRRSVKDIYAEWRFRTLSDTWGRRP